MGEPWGAVSELGKSCGTMGVSSGGAVGELGDSLIVYPSCVARRAVTHCVGPCRASCVVLRPFGYVVRRVMGPGCVVRRPLGHDPEKSCSGRSMLNKKKKKQKEAPTRTGNNGENPKKKEEKEHWETQKT